MAAIALLVAAAWGGLTELVTRWNNQEEYSHGYFIPLIALWLLWQRREALLGSIGRPSWFGFVLLAVAMAMLVLGELTAIFILIQYGFLLGLLGLVLCHGGVPLARVSVLPIALLVFAIPLPYFVDSQLSWRLQLLSSMIGVDVLRLIGTSVYLEGNVIDLGVYKLQVVEACSGLRYLYPLLSIGFLMAYMYRAPFWRQAVLFLSTIPITVLMNSLRIAVVGILVGKWGTEQAEGFLHYFEGWIIFMVCLAILLAEIWLFERFGSKRRIVDAMDVPVITGAGGLDGRVARLSRPLLASIVLLVGAAALMQMVGNREEIRPAREPLAGYPLVLGDWRAQEEKMDVLVEQKLGLDDYLLADYRKVDGQTVNFYVAYYGSQRKGVSPHSPQVCIPGGGWLIVSLDRVPVTVSGESFEINRTVIEKAGQRQLVYYWFDQRGRRIANEYSVKWYLLLDALKRNRTDGSLVRVTTSVGAMESVADADRRLVEFMQFAVPGLAPYVPH
ncbi:MAG: VPLPA-CTERM-specific exosortase XrtD [Thiobacillus sp.]|nr:VPLPA-CTERM-specific exosortase XrtD [Thiobacillus sp.]